MLSRLQHLHNEYKYKDITILKQKNFVQIQVQNKYVSLKNAFSFHCSVLRNVAIEECVVIFIYKRSWPSFLVNSFITVITNLAGIAIQIQLLEFVFDFLVIQAALAVFMVITDKFERFLFGRR